MEDKRKKIELSEEVEIKMLQFFMKTSIPRKMREEREKKGEPPIKKN